MEAILQPLKPARCFSIRSPLSRAQENFESPGARSRRTESSPRSTKEITAYTARSVPAGVAAVGASAGQVVPVLTSGRATVSKTRGAAIASGSELVASSSTLGRVTALASAISEALSPGIGTCVASAASGDATVQADLQIIPVLGGGGVAGVTAKIPLAKLTPGGRNGSETFTDGILTAYVAPT